MKIAIFGGYKNWEKEYLVSELSKYEAIFDDLTIDKSILSDGKVEVVSIFVDSVLGAKEMDRFPKLRLIAARSTGFDNIDMVEATKRGIKVANVPTYGENTVAEYGFALLLTLSRKIYDTVHRVRESGSFSQDGFEGYDLMGKTIGVVGSGHIGEHSIRIAKGFGMNVLAFDVKQNMELAAELGFRYATMDELLSQSNIVTLHAPYNSHTHHMLGKDAFAKMKRGMILVNTARGGLVDTDALVHALHEGIVAGAALDVLEGEGDVKDEFSFMGGETPDMGRMKTLLENRYLIDNPNVILTPHNAFNTREAITRILAVTVENINAFAGGTPTNVVSGS